MIVIACPGQGSQTPGFLEPWLQDPANRIWLDEVSALIGIDMVKHGTVSDAETIRATNIAQPLIVSAGILSLKQLRSELAELPEQTAQAVNDKLVYAGHSVGEITAAYGAGVFSAETALRFVAKRAAAMQECALAADTSMAAVLGGDRENVLTKLTEHNLTAANHNGAGQIVAAGDTAAVRALVADPPAKTRVIQLQVAGAFHTDAMAAARDQLAESASDFAVTDPAATIYTNSDGSVVASGAKYLELLISQVANPVRWDLCLAAFADSGVTQLVELAPSGALAGLAKRGLPGVQTVKIGTPADVKALVAQLAAQG